jgi:hypothetical protein
MLRCAAIFAIGADIDNESRCCVRLDVLLSFGEFEHSQLIISTHFGVQVGAPAATRCDRDSHARRRRYADRILPRALFSSGDLSLSLSMF